MKGDQFIRRGIIFKTVYILLQILPYVPPCFVEEEQSKYIYVLNTQTVLVVTRIISNPIVLRLLISRSLIPVGLYRVVPYILHAPSILDYSLKMY